MAVLKMKQVNLIALSKDRKKILEQLQRGNVVEIKNIDYKDNVFDKKDTSNQKQTFEKNSVTAKKALEILDKYIPCEKSLFSSFEGKREMTVNDYYTFCEENQQTEIMKIVYNIISKEKIIENSKSEKLKNDAQSEALIPWLGFDVPLSYSSTKKTMVYPGVIQGEFPENVLIDKISSITDCPFELNIISSSKAQTCVSIIYLKENMSEIQKAITAIGLSSPPIKSMKAPSLFKAELTQKNEDLDKLIVNNIDGIKNYIGFRNAIKFIIDYFTMRQEKYQMIERLIQSKHTIYLTGYIPLKDEKKLIEIFKETENIAIEFFEPEDSEDTPIALKNCKFASSVEGVVESYAMPKKGEVDPSFMMALFYYFLFGIMLSDAAYGLIMVFSCGFVLLKFKNISESLEKSVRMFFYCGISTTCWGFLFGGFFGDAISVISNTFFGANIALPPIWFEPIKDPMLMLMFSLAVGIIHIFTGLAIQFYQLCKQKKFKDAIYDVVFWYILIISLLVILFSTSIFADIAKVTLNIPEIVINISSVLALLSAIGIILTAGRESRNPFKRFLKGLYGLYNISGYLSDILSYSRLLALGLATGVIANVVNKMGSMMGNGIIGIIGFILVFIVGHVLNIGINLLGAYVHTNRLQFVEFFGKFYEGGGRKFNPFGIHTKYFKIK